MKRMTLTKRVTLSLLSFIVLSPMAIASDGTSDAALSLTLETFLVRHAEKQTGPDPALTKEGDARAEALADLLLDAGIEHILSSDYRRTRDTAAPLAKRLGLEVTLYDPRDLPALVEGLNEKGGRYLIVGHSNTTPYLAHLLGGEPGEPIVEATEYDRLYLITRQDDQVSSVLLRYGTPSPREATRGGTRDATQSADNE